MSLFEEALGVFEPQDLSGGRCVKFAAALQNAVYYCRVIYVEKRRVRSCLQLIKKIKIKKKKERKKKLTYIKKKEELVP